MYINKKGILFFMKLKCDICGKEYRAYGYYRSKERHLCDACISRRNKFIRRLKINIKYDKEDRDGTIFRPREADW